jgi:uridine phosphorylase
MSLQHHIGLGAEHLSGNEGLGRYVFLPGDPDRAGRIAEAFDFVEVVEGPRRFTAWLGQLAAEEGPPIDVLALPSGIGGGSAEVVIHELMEAGARRIVRVGSCGSSVPAIEPGGVVIATAAVRDDGASDDYAAPGFPAVASPLALDAMRLGALRAGHGEVTFLGVCHSKATLYAREFGHGPAGQRNLERCSWLRRSGLVASEMEAAILFVMTSARNAGAAQPLAGGDPRLEHQAAAVLAVFARDDSDMAVDPQVTRAAERRAIEVALEGVRAWSTVDRLARR